MWKYKTTGCSKLNIWSKTLIVYFGESQSPSHEDSGSYTFRHNEMLLQSP